MTGGNGAPEAAGVKLAVLHRTTFLYGAPVIESLNTLHLQPRDFAYQKTLSAFIRVIPATRLLCFADLYHNITHHFQLVPGPIRNWRSRAGSRS